MRFLLALLAALAIAKLWLASLGASFWVDETVTAFVVRHGANDPSLSVAPQVPQSIYYILASAAQALFGLSEIAYRLPSLVAAGIALVLIARLASRLICPDAAWFAFFACLALKGIDTEASDARPYALGFCVVAASFLFLVRWLDHDRWADALGFVIAAALILRVHLLFGAVYLVIGAYAVMRRLHSDTTVSWMRLSIVFSVLGLALVPVALKAIEINRGASAHVIVAQPTLRDLADSLKVKLAVMCLVGAWIVRSVRKGSPNAPWQASAAVLAIGWWLAQPLALFGFSHITGNSVFLGRYLSVGLPGTALAATFLTSLFLPRNYWKPAALVLGVAMLFALRHGGGQSNSDWRGAAHEIDQLMLPEDTPILCPSPFIEAKSPAWNPHYALPGFLYAHLDAYPIHGRTLLLPFQKTIEAERYVAGLSQDVLFRSGRFVIYGSNASTRGWRDWFLLQPELADWEQRNLGSFGDVGAILMQRRQEDIRLR